MNTKGLFEALDFNSHLIKLRRNSVIASIVTLTVAHTPPGDSGEKDNPPQQSLMNWQHDFKFLTLLVWKEHWFGQALAFLSWLDSRGLFGLVLGHWYALLTFWSPEGLNTTKKIPLNLCKRGLQVVYQSPHQETSTHTAFRAFFRTFTVAGPNPRYIHRSFKFSLTFLGVSILS